MNDYFCSHLPDLNSYYNSAKNTVDILLDCVHCAVSQSCGGLGAIGVKRIAINEVSVMIRFHDVILRMIISSVRSKKLTTSSCLYIISGYVEDTNAAKKSA